MPTKLPTLSQIGAVLKGVASSSTSQCKGPIKRCNLAGPGREISRDKNQGHKSEGTGPISPTPPPVRFYLQDGYQMGCYGSLKYGKMFILMIVQIGSPRLSKGKWG